MPTAEEKKEIEADFPGLKAGWKIFVPALDANKFLSCWNWAAEVGRKNDDTDRDSIINKWTINPIWDEQAALAQVRTLQSSVLMNVYIVAYASLPKLRSRATSRPIPKPSQTSTYTKQRTIPTTHISRESFRPVNGLASLALVR